MEASSFLLEATVNSINEDGHYPLKDTGIGDKLEQLEQKGFPFWTKEGLDFCKRYVLFETRIRPTIRSWFGERCVLVHWLRYKAYPGHAICFRSGGPKAGRRRFMVHLLAKGSRVKYYKRSHLEELPTSETEYLFYEVDQTALNKPGFICEEHEFENGGCVMFDARICVEITQGYAVAFLFATQDVLAKWPAMYLPDLSILRDTVDEMESPEIGVNFAFGPRKIKGIN